MSSEMTDIHLYMHDISITFDKCIPKMYMPNKKVVFGGHNQANLDSLVTY